MVEVIGEENRTHQQEVVEEGVVVVVILAETETVTRGCLRREGMTPHLPEVAGVVEVVEEAIDARGHAQKAHQEGDVMTDPFWNISCCANYMGRV